MKLFKIWDDEGEHFTIMLANDKEEADKMYVEADPEIREDGGHEIEELTDLADMTPRYIACSF